MSSYPYFINIKLKQNRPPLIGQVINMILGSRKFTRSKTIHWILTISILTLFFTCIFPIASPKYTSVAKPMEFYFHHVENPIPAGGTETKYVMNTDRQFEFLTQQEAYENAFYKPIGLPKIVIDFYLNPHLAGPVTLDGNWQVFVWVNSTAYKPTGFALNFKEITAGGNILWDSGLISPEVTSNIGSYLDVPISNYNLSTPLTHQFNAGSTLLVEVEVNAGSSAETRIWYDSALYPSKAILPAKDYARPTSINTYNVENQETTLFYYNWSEAQRKVIVRSNVTDPFGAYDIYHVNTTILDPKGTAVIDNFEMTRISSGLGQSEYSQVFETTWSYPVSAVVGNYTVIVTVIDNNGNYRRSLSGSFSPFIEKETFVFNIGIVEYYDPKFLVTDDINDPLPNAQVYLTWANGTKETYPRYTSPNGFINLTDVPQGDYSFTILWKDKIVKETAVNVNSSNIYTIKTQVYRLNIQVLDKNGIPVYGSYVVAETPSGVGYGLDISDKTGIASFRLPSGDYNIKAHYTTDYWLTMVQTEGNSPVTISESMSSEVILSSYPPEIWTTVGFILAISSIAIVITAIAIFYVYFIRMNHRR
jgi:hypothetical protein